MLVFFVFEKEDLKLLFEVVIVKLLKDVKIEKLIVYVDKVLDEFLMVEVLKGGKIVLELKDNIFGVIILIFFNGVKVIIKKIDFKVDEIWMKGVSLGGSFVFLDLEIININGLDVVGVGGLGNFSVVNFEKVFVGKKVLVSYDIVNKIESVLGSCLFKDFEMMM